MTFPRDFLWGAATASYQIEGAALEDGRGLSVWDMLCRKPGAVWNGHTGEVADDHYHRYREDVALMKAIGLQAYRFSISWPRVLPAGTGAINEAGLDFYDRLVDELLAAGIQPWVTLFHWDYPYDLFCRGGWLNPYSSDWFADYTTIIVKRLSDRVRHWMTLNEPQCFIGLGHREGVHAPGLKLDWPEVLRAWHNSLLAHGKAVLAIRAHSKAPAVVGAAPTGFIAHPASDAPADIEAARRATFTVHEQTLWNYHMFYDPVYKKEYPPEAAAVFGNALPQIGSRDMDIIGQPIDFTA
ncbi:MAG: glycoside hydrolase family 1 protein, partial [Anaerolineae bacterium]